MKKVFLFFIFLAVFSGFFCYGQEVSLTLDEAVAIALRANRDILLKAQDIDKAKIKIAEAKAALFPSLTLNGGWTETRGLYSKDVGVNYSQFSFKQPLYQGGKTINSIKYNEYAEAITQALFDKTKLDVVYNVKKAFYTLLLSRQFYILNKDICDNTLRHFDSVKQRYAKGEASHSDVLKMKAAFSQVKQALRASANQLRYAAAYLKNLLYLDENIIINPQGKFTCRVEGVVYRQALAKAHLNRPEIKQYSAQEKANQAALDAAYAGNRPSVYASWDYYARSHLAAGTARNPNDYNVIGITVSWPIFDGWLTKAKIDQAFIDLNEAKILKEKALTDIVLDLESAYIDLKDCVAKASSVKSQVDFYKNAFLEARDKYKAGIVSNLGLDDSLLSFKVAQFNQKQAIYDCIVSKIKFDKAKGEI